MTFTIHVGRGMGAHGLNQRKMIKGCFLGTPVGDRFVSAVKSVILFPTPGRLRCCYHLQGLLAAFINALLPKELAGQKAVMSQMGLLCGGAERQTRLRAPSTGGERDLGGLEGWKRLQGGGESEPGWEQWVSRRRGQFEPKVRHF